MNDAFEPVAVEERYPPPRADVSPDRTKGWIRRLLPILVANWPAIAVMLATLTALMGLGIALPWVIAQTIDAGLTGEIARPGGPLGRALDPFVEVPEGALYPILPLVVVIGAIAVLRLVTGYVSGLYSAKVTQGIDYHLRSIIYEKLAGLSFSYYDRSQSGQLISRANADIRALQMFLSFAPRLAITGFSFVFALAMMISWSWKLALAGMATIPPVYFIALAMRSRLFPISWVIQARQADIATIVEENVSGVRIVKSFTAEERQIGLLARAAERLQWASIMQVDIRAKFSPALMTLPRVSRALLLGVGGYLAIQGEITVGMLVAANMYIMQLQAPFRMIGFLMIMAQRAAASALRIFEVLDEVPDVQDLPGAVDLTHPSGEVELDRVTFGYGADAPVLQELCLKVKPGETVAIVGRTGSGKSTIARLLPRFYDVQSGRVLVDGRDVREYTVKSLRAQIGLVLDEPFLFSDTVHNNIAYGRPSAKREEVVLAAQAAGAHEFVTRLGKGYDTVIGERGYTLSGGQRQRIAIARTLLVNPKFLILDDATSSIDVALETQIHDALRELMHGRTTIIIAHRLSTISLADRVLLLGDGQIIADGRHEDLMRNVKEYAEILSRAESERAAARAAKQAAAAQTADATTARRRAMMGRGAGEGMAGGEDSPALGAFVSVPDVKG